jgi:predicted exporter
VFRGGALPVFIGAFRAFILRAERLLALGIINVARAGDLGVAADRFVFSSVREVTLSFVVGLRVSLFRHRVVDV